MFSNTVSRLDGGSTRCKGSACDTELLELLLVERLNALVLLPRLLVTSDLFLIDSLLFRISFLIEIKYTNQLLFIFLRHLLLGIHQCQFRIRSFALNTTFCCSFKLSNCITHHGLLLQDVLGGEVHDLLIGYRNNLGQLRLESSSPFHELRFADGIDLCL